MDSGKADLTSPGRLIKPDVLITGLFLALGNPVGDEEALGHVL